MVDGRHALETASNIGAGLAHPLDAANAIASDFLSGGHGVKGPAHPSDLSAQLAEEAANIAQAHGDLQGSAAVRGGTKMLLDLIPVILSAELGGAGAGAIGASPATGTTFALGVYGAAEQAHEGGRATVTNAAMLALPFAVISRSGLGGVVGRAITRARGPAEEAAGMASEVSPAARLVRYKKLLALANDASTTDAERALAGSRARALAETLKETSQAEIDKAVGALRQRLVAEVAGLSAQGATNAAQFVGTAAALELAFNGKKMTAGEILKQGLLMAALEAMPVITKAREVSGKVREFRDAEAGRRSLDFGPDQATPPIGVARQLTAEGGDPGAAAAQPEAPTGPTSIIHTPLGRPIDPEVVRAEVQSEIAARSGVVPGANSLRRLSSKGASTANLEAKAPR